MDSYLNKCSTFANPYWMGIMAWVGPDTGTGSGINGGSSISYSF